jgi:hypothetical protein
MSPSDHITLFVANSSRKRTRVPRRVTGRLMVRHLVNINLGRPKTSSTAALRKPHHHHLLSPRSESKSLFFLKRAHGVKRAILEAGERGGAPAPARRAQGGEAAPPAEPEKVPPPRPPSPRWWSHPARGGAAAHAHWGEAAPAQGGEAAPVQGGAAARGGRACSCTKCWGCLLVNEVIPRGFYEASKDGRSSRGPTTQSSTADDREGLRLHDKWLVGDLERGVLAPVDDNGSDDGGLDVSSSSSGSGSDTNGGAPPAETTST